MKMYKNIYGYIAFVSLSEQDRASQQFVLTRPVKLIVTKFSRVELKEDLSKENIRVNIKNGLKI